MPELPVKEIRRSELHLPEIKRDDIVRSLSEIRLPAIELPKVELPRREDPASRFDWRSVDLGAAVAGAAALAQAGARAGRPLFRRSRVTVAAGTIVVVGLIAAAVLATPAVRQRAGATVRRVRDRVDARMTPSDVLELGDDATTDQLGDLPSAGELVTDGTLPAPEAAVPDADVPIAR
jgi:hypothetical protein